MTSRSYIYILFLFLTLVAFWGSLVELLHFSLEHEFGTHILVIPAVSAYLLYIDRKTIFSRRQSWSWLGIASLLFGVSLFWISRIHLLSFVEADQLSLTIFSIIVIWTSAFLLCFGTQSFRAALFPLCFLFLMVPIPSALLQHIVGLLQRGSAEVANSLFNLAAVPVLREGFIFALPGLSIEVAQQCSGIRSSLALFTSSLIIGHLFLRSVLGKAFLNLCFLPIVMVTNGLRITVLSLLAIYVDPSFISGNLHHRGGFLFFLLAFGLTTALMLLLRKCEERFATPQATNPGAIRVFRRDLKRKPNLEVGASADEIDLA